MGKRALRKDLRMEIKKNKGRFLSIFLIVALGVAFFSGLRVTEHDMRYTADAFGDSYQMMDIRIISTMGLTETDTEVLAEVDGIKDIEGSKMQYVLSSRNDVDYVLELTAVPEKLNRIQVTDGRMPQKPDECLADNALRKTGWKLGDTIVLKADGKTELEDTLTETEFEIVGFGDAPLYIGMERGSATLGNGQVSGFVMVIPEIFKQEYYSQIYLTVDAALDQLVFTEDYAEVVADVQEKIKAIEEERCLARYDEIYAEAEAEIMEGSEEYEEKKAEAEQELADARQELDDGWRELEEGKQEIADGQAELEDTKTELEDTKSELETTKTDLEEQLADVLLTKEELEAQKEELLNTKSELEAQRAELVTTKTDLETQQADALAMKSELETQRAGLAATKTELETQQAQALAAKTELESQQAQLTATKSSLETQRAELVTVKSQLEAQRPELVAVKTELESQRAEVVAQQTPLLEQKAELESAKSLLETKRAEVVAQKTELETQQSQMVAAKAELEIQIPALQTQRRELQAQRVQLELMQGGLELQIPPLQNTVTGLQYIQSELAARRTALETRRAELEALAAAGTPDTAGEIQLAIEDEILKSLEQENTDNLASAQAGLTEAQNNLNAVNDGFAQLDAGLLQIEEALPQMETALAEINTNLPLVEEGLIQVNVGLGEIDANLAEVNSGLTQLNAGLAEIENGLAQLDAGLAEVNTGIAQLDSGLLQANDGIVQIDAALPQINDGLAQIAPVLEEVNNGLPQLADGLAQVNSGIGQIDAGLAEINSGLPQLEDGLVQVNDGIAQIDDGMTELEDGLTQLEDGLTEVNDGIVQLEDGLAEVEDGLVQIEDGFAELADAQAELEDAKLELADGEQELLDGEEEYKTAKEDAETQLAEAKEEIDDAWEELGKLEVPSWYVTDRDDLPGYFEFGANAERIGAIGKVFPAIFFLVAALVALTAITRMVEEQRTQIGTYKALGYSKMDITFKYLAYAMLATVGGGIAGVLAGEKIFPFVIIICYRIMYTPLLDIVIPYDLKYALLSIGIAVASTAAATLFACWHELAAQPAVLMRPVAPKAGKRVFLERISILWRHLSFSQKATFRNLFRYKKRLIMTVFGIGCCCGLMVVGFGLKDSIMNIASIQYDNIQLYDAMVSIEEDISEENQAVLEEELNGDGRLISSAKLMMKSMDAQTDQAIRTAYVVVTEHKDALDTMMVFRNRDTHEQYALDDEGVMLSEQLSNALGVGIGDSISIQSGNTIVEAPISGISENYLMHYIYMTESVYQEVFGTEPDYNMYWLDLTEEGKAEEQTIGKHLINMDGVLTVNYVSANRESIEQMLNSLYLIVIVLVIAASLLAFVVIYNLNNINISERRRELATLKLLGFYDMEVASYVYRENIYLTLIGAVAGLFMGKFLHSFVINTIEVSQIMFGRVVSVPSYLYCVVLTIVFSAVVNAVMFFQLKKIDMVESLKSVE